MPMTRVPRRGSGKRALRERTDPLASPPELPTVGEPTHEDLLPFMPPAWSPYQADSDLTGGVEGGERALPAGRYCEGLGARKASPFRLRV